jgi:hypothetical protein
MYIYSHDDNSKGLAGFVRVGGEKGQHSVEKFQESSWNMLLKSCSNHRKKKDKNFRNVLVEYAAEILQQS